MAALVRFPLPIAQPCAIFKSFSSSARPMLFSSMLFVPRNNVLQGESHYRRFSSVRDSVSDDGQEAAVPTSVPVRVAHELLQAGHRYLDVRTVDEFNAGHVVGAMNIPFLLKVGSGMTRNPNFLNEVAKAFRKDDEILIGCQSGRRSLMAAAELSSMGFNAVVDVAGGYSAWVNNNLPTEQ
ncbi:hypothetical protein HPP92_012549 [Vanilla planifolia]|uniref:Rhodanese domain-containing protein n=1 Tax=Vanilla planifolia TaxID=51239 RepID=A0A835QQP4_VANPL|nr:hypothetical protein HPP92_012549 [Vanilla planifolia]